VSNKNRGISVGPNCTVTGNTVRGNGFIGIQVETNCVVMGNVTAGNANDGLFTGGSCLVLSNTAVGNGNRGFALSVADAYGSNVIASNTGGNVSGGVQIGTNLCNGTTTCP
jgi:hypothetical protein